MRSVATTCGFALLANLVLSNALSANGTGKRPYELDWAKRFQEAPRHWWILRIWKAGP